MDAHFFITGGTGFIGSNLIPRLLGQDLNAKATVLIRAKDNQQAKSRHELLIQQIEKLACIDNIRERLNYVLGDVTLANCGIQPSRLEELFGQITHIIHGAAILRFDLSLEQTREINLEGTRRVLQIAHECCQRGQFENFVYIGTSSVSGKRQGIIYEHELEMGQQFFNTYEQSKYETEQLLHRNMGSIPITIFRPSIVIGDSKTGRTTLFNVIYYPLRFIRDGLLTWVPGTHDTLIDLVPVDWVTDAMSIIIGNRLSVGQTYHLTAGPQRAVKLGDFLNHGVRFFDTNCPLEEPRQLDLVNIRDYQSRTKHLTGRMASLYAKMGLLFGYATVDRLFDTANTDDALKGSGLRFPKYESYADTILQYCLLTDWGKKVI